MKFGGKKFPANDFNSAAGRSNEFIAFVDEITEWTSRYMQPDLVDGELYLAPNFPAPPNTDYQGYHNYIDEIMPPESPYLYGLHPNAEIGFLTTTSESLFRTVFEMQPRYWKSNWILKLFQTFKKIFRDAGASGGATVTREDKVKQVLDEILEKLPEEFNMSEIMGKVEERTPYVIVAFQECERMNFLTCEIKRSLKELDLGLKVISARSWRFANI